MAQCYQGCGAAVQAIRTNPKTLVLCKNLAISLPRKVTPALSAAMHDTGDDGTGQMVMPGVIL